MAKLFANSGKPHQASKFVAFDLGLHCLPVILFGVSSLQWVNLDTVFENFAHLVD